MVCRSLAGNSSLNAHSTPRASPNAELLHMTDGAAQQSSGERLCRMLIFGKPVTDVQRLYSASARW
jgi:hypothetical protein